MPDQAGEQPFGAGHHTSLSPWQVMLPVGLGTGLSLLGDSTLYAVLPTHLSEAGVTLAGVGILLSANRFIRLGLNGPLGWLYDRVSRRRLFVLSLFVGTFSTALYALTQGFAPLLVARLLWGVAWAGIWIGGNAIILDVTSPHNRGHWVGIYQISFFLGAAGGAIIGGFLTDWLGYHRALGIEAGLTLLGAVIALFSLPETRRARSRKAVTPTEARVTNQPDAPGATRELATATALLGVNRLLIAGLLLPTMALFLAQQIGESMTVGGYRLGVATLTGLALGANSLIAMLAAPLIGRWSDRLTTRWQAASGGLLPGVAGFSLLAWGVPGLIFVAIPLTAIAGGSGQSLATTIVGDLSNEQQRGRRLGMLFTIGDLTSAIGPPLAYNFLLPALGLSLLYLLSGGIYAIMLLVALSWVIIKLK